MDEIQELFGRTVRVKVVDGRVIDGDLQAIDKDMTIVVDSAKEYHGISDVNFVESSGLVRHIGMAIIPGRTVESIYLKK